eukprot:Tamp_21385.p1 GENE.Tamp_21385~~Tamp_21385.p1  ORF type:complete len:366 (-),score=94.77 Tamp_21385:51-1109(-)
MEDYRFIKKLGAGGQGTTHQARRTTDGQMFVIKQVLCGSIKEANDALKEAKVLQRLAHTGIVKYEDVFLHEATEELGGAKKLGVCIVMELCEMGDLTARLKHMRDVQRSAVPETMALAWMEEMSSALAYIHSQKTLHRDLKPLNIFISRNAVKIGDFGLARKVVADRMSRVGTPCYLAPEVLNAELYAEEADIWGLGCIALEILSLQFLWEQKGLLAIKVLQREIAVTDMNKAYMLELRQSVARMLVHNQRLRPSAQEIYSLVRQLNAKKNGPYVPPPPQAHLRNQQQAPANPHHQPPQHQRQQPQQQQQQPQQQQQQHTEEHAHANLDTQYHACTCTPAAQARAFVLFSCA